MNHEWRTISLLIDAEDAVLTAFDERGWPISYAVGEPILWEGDECQAVYFIISGMVEVYRTAIDGREHTLRVLRAGDSFNLVPALLKDGKNIANVRCLQQTDLLLTDKNDLKDILTRFPGFSLRVLQDLAERLAGMTGLAGELALHSVRQRTAAFLMRAAETKKEDQYPRWTQDDMARQVGTVRDVIGRTLREFEEKGLIKRNRGNISLIDRDGLEKTANGLE
ncbi:MAG: Crp/Fnr family transcriptional regulator [Pelolinea sp.]|nr:Crp/Fnr family transcriptional regulator [Pelolinea sp.]